jgi:RNA polymerase sigma factor (sigma-70 family)
LIFPILGKTGPTYIKTSLRTWYYERMIVSGLGGLSGADALCGPSMLEDELLKWRLRQGSTEALSRVYEKYLDSLLTLAMGLLHNSVEAQDVVHDVFVSLAQCTREFKMEGSLRAYLATSVVHRVRDRMRRDRTRAGHLNSYQDTRPEPDRPDELIIGSEETQRLNRAMMELPQDQKEVIVLRLKGDMRFREIAALQGVPLRTVQARYRYGLNKLRSALNGEVNP